jgi:CBS domain-containing protein
MIVRLWMSQPPIGVAPTTPVADVALEMSRRRIRRMLVLEPTQQDRLLGIVSLHDVARAFPADVNPMSVGDWSEVPDRPVSDIMTRNPITTGPDAAIDAVAAVMQRHKIGAMPVVRGPSAVGLITESDVFRAFVTMTGGEESGARVTFDLAESEDPLPLIAAVAARHGIHVASFLSMRHEGRRLASVRLVGAAADELVDELWRSGHRVVSVERLSTPG